MTEGIIMGITLTATLALGFCLGVIATFHASVKPLRKKLERSKTAADLSIEIAKLATNISNRIAEGVSGGDKPVKSPIQFKFKDE